MLFDIYDMLDHMEEWYEGPDVEMNYTDLYTYEEIENGRCYRYDFHSSASSDTWQVDRYEVRDKGYWNRETLARNLTLEEIAIEYFDYRTPEIERALEAGVPVRDIVA